MGKTFTFTRSPTDCAKRSDFRGATLEAGATIEVTSSRGVSTTRELSISSWRRIKRSVVQTAAAAFNMGEREKFEFYKWRCPDCPDGTCQVVNLGEEFRQEVEQLDHDIMLYPVELQILGT